LLFYFVFVFTPKDDVDVQILSFLFVINWLLKTTYAFALVLFLHQRGPQLKMEVSISEDGRDHHQHWQMEAPSNED